MNCSHSCLVWNRIRFSFAIPPACQKLPILHESTTLLVSISKQKCSKLTLFFINTKKEKITKCWVAWSSARPMRIYWVIHNTARFEFMPRRLFNLTNNRTAHRTHRPQRDRGDCRPTLDIQNERNNAAVLCKTTTTDSTAQSSKLILHCVEQQNFYTFNWICWDTSSEIVQCVTPSLAGPLSSSLFTCYCCRRSTAFALMQYSFSEIILPVISHPNYSARKVDRKWKM